MQLVEVGAVVVVDCMNPREKLWGVLLRLDALGVVVRGLDLNSVEDWLQQVRGGGEAFLGPSTVFIPTHRLQRLYLEESRGGVMCFEDRVRETCGREARDVLTAGMAEIGAEEER